MSPHAAFADAGVPGHPQVLLVDDDEVNLLMTAHALRERGFRITEVPSGEAALARLADWTPDIVVLDAMMPGLDGFETCRRMRRLPGYENVPVLMLTGLDDDQSIARAYEAGATDFFVKATQWSLLAGRLHYLLRASRTRIELERSKSKLARAQDLARMGSFDWRRGDAGIAMSPEGLRVFGLLPHERVGLRLLLRMIPREERRLFLRLLHDRLRQASPLRRDLPIVLFDGSRRTIHVEAEPEFNEHGQSTGYTGIVQDVTDRRAAEDRIRRLANFDTLTGLPNRNQMTWRLDEALKHARQAQHAFALLLIDLDQFKVVNDTLGHVAGDDLLLEVARRLKGCVRHSEQVAEGTLESAGTRSHRALEAVGRLGGDEFVALLPEVGDVADAERVAQRVLDVMREPIFLAVDERRHNQECFVTASVGIAIYPRDGNSVEDLMRNADIAMYSVKDAGRNAAAVYSPHLAPLGARKLELQSALHKAIERNELVLHYQPKVDVRQGLMIGAEALMRWNRGGRLVPPAEFIPLAEETNLIVPMSEWALREAARQAKAWQAAFGFEGSIAVNLPSRMFSRSDLVETIHEAVTSAGVPHRALALEITESSLMKDLQDVKLSLHKLNDIGVEVAIDDFGTGYSSLAYLTTLPISELKIDRQFVRELGMTQESSAVVTAILALARALRLRAVAEGVETLRQMETLHRLGCTLMQGYLFSRPMPSSDVERWVQQTVLPKRAQWIGEAVDPEFDAARAAGGVRLR